jgi:long-chain acyl-CoA synthetase
MEKPWTKHYDADVPGHLKYPAKPLFWFLHQSANRFPLQACTIFNDLSISYARMEQLSNRLAKRLVGLGICKGDQVGLCMPNIPQFVLSFYAILKAGGVVVALNPLYKQAEMSFQLADAGVEIVLCHTTALPVLREVEQEGIAMLRIITRVEDADQLAAGSEGQLISTIADQLAGEISLMELLQPGNDDSPPEVDITPDEPAVFQYSGGTTGIPKGAIGLHHNLVANTIQFRTWLVGMQEGRETVLTAIPLYHVYSMVIAMSMGIALGARLILIVDPRNFTDLLEKIDHYRPSIFPGVPGLFHGINQHPDVQTGKYDLSSIRACISGSAPLLRDVKERFEALTGGKLVEGYGLSEAPTATHCNPLLGENRTGSIGLPLPDVDARIVDLEDGWTDVPYGTSGELIVRGPQIMAGYHNKPEENQMALRDGWLFTGDVARMDADGYFYLVGRKKEVIKAGGFQVWPREVEEVIVQHPRVLEAGVAGVMRPGRGETVKAWVVLKPETTCSVEEIQWWCEKHLVQYKSPTEVEFVERLPRTGVGKLLRRELVRMDQERGE